MDCYDNRLQNVAICLNAGLEITNGTTAIDIDALCFCSAVLLITSARFQNKLTLSSLKCPLPEENLLLLFKSEVQGLLVLTKMALNSSDDMPCATPYSPFSLGLVKLLSIPLPNILHRNKIKN